MGNNFDHAFAAVDACDTWRQAVPAGRGLLIGQY